MKVGLADVVKPSPIGSKWGLGGTCVNVGCIPKKLMHYTALLGEELADAKEGGWEFKENVEHKWELLVQQVQNHIQVINKRTKLYVFLLILLKIKSERGKN